MVRVSDSAVLLPGVFELLVVGVYLGFIALTAVLAARRGRSALLWGLLAVVLTWIAALLVVLLPRGSQGT